jgi:hypothetical protein
MASARWAWPSWPAAQRTEQQNSDQDAVAKAEHEATDLADASTAAGADATPAAADGVASDGGDAGGAKELPQLDKPVACTKEVVPLLKFTQEKAEKPRWGLRSQVRVLAGLLLTSYIRE